MVNDSSPQPSPGCTHVFMCSTSKVTFAYAIPVPKFSPIRRLILRTEY